MTPYGVILFILEVIMVGVNVRVNNKMQKGYTYKLVKPRGDLSDLIGFEPELSPLEMISYGIMGGKYFSDVVFDFEYPKEIRDLIKEKSAGIPSVPKRELNYFGVLVDDNRSKWVRSNLIFPEDPRGWIEWYLRTWLGRRSSHDKVMVNRWILMKRRLSLLSPIENPEDRRVTNVRRRQDLLEWAFDTVNNH